MSSRSLVLVVDDEPSIVVVLEMLLSIDGHEVVSARDARSALALAHERTPDLILLDLNMPVMDGRQFLEEYLRDEPSPPPIVLLTGGEVPRNLPGVVGCMAKPFRLDSLSQTVRQHLAAAP